MSAECKSVGNEARSKLLIASAGPLRDLSSPRTLTSPLGSQERATAVSLRGALLTKSTHDRPPPPPPRGRGGGGGVDISQRQLRNRFQRTLPESNELMWLHGLSHIRGSVNKSELFIIQLPGSLTGGGGGGGEGTRRSSKTFF